MGQHGRTSPRTRRVIRRGRRVAGNAPRSRGRSLSARRRERGRMNPSNVSVSVSVNREP
ncbi:hypothetical protein DIJ63_11640 [Burkholderia pseudomallei]|nr:hypothetical protein DIJ62_10450 [Burkholderia pseudomallei]TPB75678.1 hypothetical protein DIJ63_11640 [Burkholderia pseudomallei]